MTHVPQQQAMPDLPPVSGAPPQSSYITPDEFKAKRKRLGLAQAIVGTFFGGVSSRTVAKWEAGSEPIPELVKHRWANLETLYPPTHSIWTLGKVVPRRNLEEI